MRLILMALFIGGVAQAQTIDKIVNDNSSDESTTTIEIKKKKGAANTPAAQAIWEFSDGTADIQGETSAMNRAAKESWQKSCNSWKKEFREDNKENRIINLNCGIPNCGGDAGNVVCTSKATYKIKSKMN